MSDEELIEQGAEAVQGMENIEAHFHDLMELFDELSFREKWRRVFDGLKQPADSGPHKWARLQMIRLSAPVAAIAVPLMVIGIIMLLPAKALPPPSVEVEMLNPEEIEDLEEIEEIEIEPPEMPDVEQMEFDAEVTTVETPAPPTDFSPQPTEVDAVAIVKSPIIMRGIYGSRTPGMRGSLLGRHGAPQGTEQAVLRALRWLKKYQHYDGYWPGNAGGGEGGQNSAWTAYTGMALLTFLAHGETPNSEEFGETVEKAIRWLVENQKASGKFGHVDGHDYSHPIATYAMCEAYGMTRIPILKDAAYKAVDVIVKGVNKNVGGWNYNCDGSGRNDTSYSAWCCQALKAAKMAGLDNDGLQDAMKLGIKGLIANSAGGKSDSLGGFGYTGPQRSKLTGAGVLCMQLLGKAQDSHTLAGMRFLEENSRCRWVAETERRPFYYWYYDTQAFFHHGGAAWKSWNKQFANALCKNQTVVKDAILDMKGDPQDIGYWKNLSQTENYGYVYNTTLCALMLQVYYRFLPTYAEIKIEEEAVPELKNVDDLKIDLIQL